MRPILWVVTLALAGARAGAMPFAAELDLPRDYSSHRVAQMVALNPGGDFTLLDVEGPGAISHIWMTLGNSQARRVVLRMYWDDESDPSVESPVADFFGVGHNALEPEHYFATPALVVAPKNGYNIYLPMPFRKRARIVVTNEQDEALSDGGGIYFQADYLKYERLSEQTPYFHAQWRREAPAPRRGRPYTFVQAVGEGFIAGVTHHVRVQDNSDDWFHGGGDLLFLDGQALPNLIKGIGGEDFFGESWSSSPFSSPYAGTFSQKNGRMSMYRFFLEGPPRFSQSVRFAFGALQNEITSVAYWYQTEPHSRFFRMPPPSYREPGQAIVPGAFDVELLSQQQVTAAIIGPFYGNVETATPLDGATDIDLSRPLRTNYGAPYKQTIPDNHNGSVRWERARTVLSWLDFDAAYKPKMELVRGVRSLPDTFSYVLLSLHAEERAKPELLLGYDDPAQIWLNGKPLRVLEGSAGFTRATIDLPLVKGRNDLLIKVTNTWNVNWAAYAISLYFRHANRIRFDAFETLPETLELGR